MPPPFSLLLYPPPPTPFNACYTLRMKKKVGELLLGREEKKSAIPVLFFLPLIPHSFQRMLHTQRMKKKVGVLFWTGRRRKVRPPSIFPFPLIPLIPYPFQCLPCTLRMKHKKERGWVTFGSGITANIYIFLEQITILTPYLNIKRVHAHGKVCSGLHCRFSSCSQIIVVVFLKFGL